METGERQIRRGTSHAATAQRPEPAEASAPITHSAGNLYRINYIDTDRGRLCTEPNSDELTPPKEIFELFSDFILQRTSRPGI
ncbi:hypothetical protein EVAR_37259_1 [Eumeta japonica]|uniref:Uncharacterized protein n=1 Tax=Eumeta variegata TaxID=151549 RepID=A0A4C1WK71_EUMVA|nr:hypothetical protein EVAR_37259_1 [Eumeta japonica]